VLVIVIFSIPASPFLDNANEGPEEQICNKQGESLKVIQPASGLRGVQGGEANGDRTQVS
jgi:hypothetical protein